MTLPPTAVLGVGLVTPLGLDAASTAAAARAGISQITESRWRDARGEPVVMGLLDDTLLPTRAGALAKFDLTPRQDRLVRLAGSALRECLGHTTSEAPWALYLGAPDVAPGEAPVADPWLLDFAAAQAGVTLDRARSRIFPDGRAAGLCALHEARRALAEGALTRVLVGAVDSHADPRLLDRLDQEGRLHARGVPDGFVPGEGAAFLALIDARRATAERLPVRARVVASALGAEPGHRYSAEPHLGTGLTQCLRALFAEAPHGEAPVRSVYAGYNGEGLWAKEWGVALTRNAQHFADDFRFEHPVDCFGDPGAALGPLMLGLAVIGVARGYRRAPCLVWCGSDREARGAALVGAT